MNDSEFQRIVHRVTKTIRANKGKDPLTYMTMGESVVAFYLAMSKLGVGGDEDTLRSSAILLYVTYESMGVILEPFVNYIEYFDPGVLLVLRGLLRGLMRLI